MTKWRKVYLCVIAVIFAGLEVFGWYIGYTDRGGFFEGLGLMLLDIWLLPAVVGILYGVFEAADCFDSPSLPIWSGFKSFGFSVLRMLGLSVFHGVVAPIIYIFALDKLTDYFEMCGIILIWSVGVGLGVFLVVYLLSKLLFCAVRDISKAYKTLKADDSDV